MLYLSKLESKLDEALSKETRESLTEWIEQEILKGELSLLEIIKQAKEMEKEQIYSEDEVREMLFMALYEPQEECCTTHTKDSIVRKVLKTFKSQ